MTSLRILRRGKKRLCAICRPGEIEDVAGAGYYRTKDSFYGSNAVAGSTAQSIIVQSDDTVVTLCGFHRHSIRRLAIPRGFVVPACLIQVVIRCSLS